MRKPDKIGRRLMAERCRAKLSQTEMGKKLGMSCYSVKNMELGIRKTSALELYEISKIFGKSMEYFLGFADD